MDRIKIKNSAKKKIRGNLWEIWKPTIIVLAISFMVSTILAETVFVDMLNNLKNIDFMNILENKSIIFEYTFYNLIIQLITIGFTIGASTYLLKFSRGKEYNIVDIFKSFSYIWVIVGTLLLSNILIRLGSLLIIPGIILSFAYSMVSFVLVDGERNIVGALKTSRKIMYGKKLDYFVFQLSFIGWILLSIPTLGLILIWLVPYYQVANALFYDEAKAEYEKSLK